MTTKLVVIAKYHEDINWIGSLNVPTIIYDKSGDKHADWVSLPNVGREGGTYLFHIINNYHQLDDMTIFTQGHPFDHCSCFIQLVNGIDGGFHYLGSTWINCRPYHRGLPIPVIWDELFTTVSPSSFDYARGGIFAVSREIIQQRPLDFYKHCLNLLFDDEIIGYIYEILWSYIFSEDIVAKDCWENSSLEEKLAVWRWTPKLARNYTGR